MSFSPESGAVELLTGGRVDQRHRVSAYRIDQLAAAEILTAVMSMSSSLEVGEGRGEDVETLQQKVVADGQWGQEAQHVAVGAAGQDDDAGGVRARAQRW